MSVIQRAADRMREQRQHGLIDSPPAPTGPEPAAPDPAPAGAAAPPAPPATSRSREIGLDFKQLGRRGFLTPSNRQSRLAEEIRLIKRRLAQQTTPPTSAGPPAGSRLGHVMLVTSARPGEGKSFIALNLALSFLLDDGLDVLLIDADIQRPTILSTLGLVAQLGDARPPGLADLLRDPALNMADVLLRDRELRLSLLPAGRPLASATNLLAQERTGRWIAEMARRYSDRMIIFDAPPVLARTEPLALASQVGQVLLVVEAGKTSAETVRTTIDLLTPASNISLILNRMLGHHSESRFGNYYNETHQD